ncbi:unnamed protein product [Ilex paraguariensis]|uniref:Inositol-tetrakisphosphate 1-kinase n=1 Tax=Ilex paraguariensis TaxID=185542 RepID=A0ABC8TF39_9AQUA
MKLNGEISYNTDGEEDEILNEVNSHKFPIGFVSPQPPKLIVGYALTSKKKKSFLQPKLVALARNKGILFVGIDLNRSLSDQGPFDVVLHKLLGQEWFQIIQDYRQKHPEVTVLDPPDAIGRINNRQSMLEHVANLNLPYCYGKVGVPRQLVIRKDPSSIPDAVTKAGLRLPLGMFLRFLCLWLQEFQVSQTDRLKRGIKETRLLNKL